MVQYPNRSLATTFFSACVLSVTLTPGVAQSASAPDTKLSVKAALVLTPEFCATTYGKNHSWVTVEEAFEIGKAICPELETALKSAFYSLTRVESTTSVGDAQIVLLPRFVDVRANRPGKAKAEREMMAVLEWTVKDAAGRTVWLDTVQSIVQHQMGRSIGQQKQGAEQLVQDSAKSLVEQSVSKLVSAPEIRKLTQ